MEPQRRAEPETFIKSLEDQSHASIRAVWRLSLIKNEAEAVLQKPSDGELPSVQSERGRKLAQLRLQRSDVIAEVTRISTAYDAIVASAAAADQQAPAPSATPKPDKNIEKLAREAKKAAKEAEEKEKAAVDVARLLAEAEKNASQADLAFKKQAQKEVQKLVEKASKFRNEASKSRKDADKAAAAANELKGDKGNAHLSGDMIVFEEPDLFDSIAGFLLKPDNLTSVGLFRVGADTEAVEAATARIAVGSLPDLNALGPIGASAVLKRMVSAAKREEQGKEPLIPASIRTRLLQVALGPTNEIAQILLQIPEPNRSWLSNVFKFFVAVSQQSVFNELRPMSIGRLLAPALLPSADPLELQRAIILIGRVVQGMRDAALREAQSRVPERSGDGQPRAHDAKRETSAASVGASSGTASAYAGDAGHPNRNLGVAAVHRQSTASASVGTLSFGHAAAPAPVDEVKSATVTAQKLQGRISVQKAKVDAAKAQLAAAAAEYTYAANDLMSLNQDLDEYRKFTELTEAAARRPQGP